MSYIPSFRLDGRVAIVTGASRGLGEHIALGLAEAGAAVAAIGRDTVRLDSTSEASRELDGSVTAFPLDVLETSALEGVVNEVQSVLGPVDILVNSAGRD